MQAPRRRPRTPSPGDFRTARQGGGKLFVTGYSEGGYVAMATERALQNAGTPVTAAAPMSGPYAPPPGTPFFEVKERRRHRPGPDLLVTAYQNAYGDLYASAADLFAGGYASSAPGLLPSTTSVGDLEAQGKFPTALFSSTPPAASYAAYTPATAPAILAGVFAAGFGTNALISNPYRKRTCDALATPDGGFPSVTTGVPAPDPTNTLRVHLKGNDLRDWIPSAPTLLCRRGLRTPRCFFFNTDATDAKLLGPHIHHPPWRRSSWMSTPRPRPMILTRASRTRSPSPRLSWQRAGASRRCSTYLPRNGHWCRRSASVQ